MNKLLYLLPCIPAFSYASEKPNIIVFIADDAGMDFGCYGNKNIHTPHIDQLAASGLKFEKAFLTSPQSSPSRTSMMTGMFAHTIGTEDLHTPIDENTRMIPSYLKEAGYRTGVMMKTHWGNNGDRQFDWVDPGKGWYKEEPISNNNPVLSRYKAFLDQDKKQPFFLWVGFIDPHRPYHTEGNVQQNDPNKVTVPPYYVDDPSTRRDLADYYDEISRLDRHIGIMMKELEDRNLLDNTVIIFLSDNGMPFPRAKGTLYDAGIQTPLIFSWKGKIQGGSVHRNGLVSTIDLAPTILDLAGMDIPEEMYGKSLSPLLYHPSERGREYIFAERNWHNCDEYIRCIRTEKYKLIYNAYYELPHGTAIDLSTSPTWYALKKVQKEDMLTKEQRNIFICPRPMIEIYDLQKDKYELNNVADEQPYLAEGKKLVSMLLKWQKDTGDHPYWKRRRPDQNDRITGFPFYPRRDEMWED
ncbi:MAG: sulfatase [Bacteroidales bacterium]|jgi:arylsulfatase A-like enzyme|nr:sulfatase [Bacteroidales bacterium]